MNRLRDSVCATYYCKSVLFDSVMKENDDVDSRTVEAREIVQFATSRCGHCTTFDVIAAPSSAT